MAYQSVLWKFIRSGGIVGLFGPSLCLARTPQELGENPIIRVLLAESATSVAIVTQGTWKLGSAQSRSLVSDSHLILSNENERIVSRVTLPGAETSQSASQAHDGDALVFVPVNETALLSLQSWPQAALRKGDYEGTITIRRASEDTLQVVATLPLENYLRGVVPSEIGKDAPAEAQKAQAVAARAAAFLALTTGMYSGDNYDICSTVQCQVYAGLRSATSPTDEAIRSTRGEILAHEGKPLPAYYAANCGGHTEEIREVWSDRANQHAYWNTARPDSHTSVAEDLRTESGFRKWVEAVPESYCNPASAKIPAWAGRNHRWTREFTADQLKEWAGTSVGAVKELKVLRRGASGRVVQLEIVGDRGSTKLMSQTDIRKWFQPALRSSAFAVDAHGPTGAPTHFTMKGAGSGHGVGMCQTGAMGMATHGWNFRAILKHYYPKAEVLKLY